MDRSEASLYTCLPALQRMLSANLEYGNPVWHDSGMEGCGKKVAHFLRCDHAATILSHGLAFGMYNGYSILFDVYSDHIGCKRVWVLCIKCS